MNINIYVALIVNLLLAFTNYVVLTVRGNMTLWRGTFLFMGEFFSSFVWLLIMEADLHVMDRLLFYLATVALSLRSIFRGKLANSCMCMCLQLAC